jgi:hypothetical protein
MNERIKALALQVGDDQNKFAALIIQDCIECCEVVAQAAIDARDGARDNDFDYFLGREAAASLCKTTIRKHFGEGSWARN